MGPLVAPGLARRVLPFAVVLLITVLTAYVDPGENRAGSAVAAVVLLAMFGMALWLPWATFPRRAQGFLLIAAVLLDGGMLTFDRGLNSHYLVLMIVPVLWLAIYDSKLCLGIGIGLASAIVLGFVVFTHPPIDDVLRGITVIAAMVAIIPPIRQLMAGNREALIAMADAADSDPLTLLANRRGFERQAPPINGSDGPGVAAFLLDVDNFKSINDTFGHAAGDELLVQIGHRLMANTRPSDVVARIGGDEFVVLSTGERAALVEFAERVRAKLCGTYQLSETSIAVRVSLGISAVYEGSADTRTLMKSADRAMYADKIARPDIDHGRTSILPAPE